MFFIIWDVSEISSGLIPPLDAEDRSVISGKAHFFFEVFVVMISSVFLTESLRGAASQNWFWRLGLASTPLGLLNRALC